MTLIQFLNTVDFETLKVQKQDLLTVIDQQVEDGMKDSLQGILHLINSIQDTAVKSCGYDSCEVF